MSLVLWSGGCDSTLVLHDLAVEKCTKQNPIRALVVSHSEVLARKEQAQARKKVLKKFKQLGLHVIVSEIEINTLGPQYSHWLNQPTVWLFAAASMLLNNETLYSGHHAGDTIWHRWNSFSNALDHMCQSMDKKYSWKVPLLYDSKAKIITRLKQVGLYKCCWWCEAPKKGKPCGNCTPCKTHELALMELKRWPPPAEKQISKGKS